MRYARSHDGQSFVIYVEATGAYTKLVLSANESYRLRAALEQFHEDRERAPMAAEAVTEIV